MVKSFVKTSDKKRMKLVYKKVIEPQLGNLISILKKMIIYSIDYYQQDQDCTQCGKHSECICR
jgi:hypothetical protein